MGQFDLEETRSRNVLDLGAITEIRIPLVFGGMFLSCCVRNHEHSLQDYGATKTGPKIKVVSVRLPPCNYTYIHGWPPFSNNGCAFTSADAEATRVVKHYRNKWWVMLVDAQMSRVISRN